MTDSEREQRRERALDRARSLKGIKVETAVSPSLYPTPAWLAERMVEEADISPGMRVLEPSAGTGAILDAINCKAIVTAIEIDYRLVDRLREKYGDACSQIFQADFLGFEVLTGPGFDRILMNPPFDHGLDVRHILHALELLAPGGRLVAICADGPRQREAFKAAELYESLPPDTFASQGTGVHTAFVVIEAAK